MEDNQQALIDRLQAAEAEIASLKNGRETKRDRKTGSIGGLLLFMLAGAIASTLVWERRADGFYPRQDVSPYLVPLVIIAGIGLGVPISAGAVGDAIDKVVPK